MPFAECKVLPRVPKLCAAALDCAEAEYPVVGGGSWHWRKLVEISAQNLARHSAPRLLGLHVPGRVKVAIGCLSEARKPMLRRCPF